MSWYSHLVFIFRYGHVKLKVFWNLWTWSNYRSTFGPLHLGTTYYGTLYDNTLLYSFVIYHLSQNPQLSYQEKPSTLLSKNPQLSEIKVCKPIYIYQLGTSYYTLPFSHIIKVTHNLQLCPYWKPSTFSNRFDFGVNLMIVQNLQLGLSKPSTFYPYDYSSFIYIIYIESTTLYTFVI